VVLSGRVRTERGQRDAETKTRDYLDAPDLSIRNRIALDSTLTVNSVGTSSVAQTPSASVEQTMTGPSCFVQCQQRTRVPAALVSRKNAAGSSVAEVGSVAASLIGGYTGIGAAALAPSRLQGG
jgi:hypothetical protein